MIDHILQIAFRLTGSRAISEKIGQRRMERRYREQAARHIAAGGVVASYRSTQGTTEFFL